MVVLDGGTGAERRQLAQIGVGVGVGSSTATVSADHRVVLTSWTSREPGCFFHVGVAPFDGSGTLVEWGRGINPSFSPDGRLVAWREASDGDCAQQALVVRDVTSGVEQRIVLTVAGQGFVTTGGPWWRDNDTIVFQDIGQDAARAGWAARVRPPDGSHPR